MLKSGAMESSTERKMLGPWETQLSSLKTLLLDGEIIFCVSPRIVKLHCFRSALYALRAMGTRLKI